MGIVRCNKFNPCLPGKIYECIVDYRLSFIYSRIPCRVGSRVTHQLEVKVFAENLFVFVDDPDRFFRITRLDCAWDLACKTCRRSDETLMVKFQEFLVDPWFVIMSIDPGERDQPAQV